MSRAKRKRVFKHTQNVQNKIILHKSHLGICFLDTIPSYLSILLADNQRPHQTARMPSMSAFARRHVFTWRGQYMNRHVPEVWNCQNKMNTAFRLSFLLFLFATERPWTFWIYMKLDYFEFQTKLFLLARIYFQIQWEPRNQEIGMVNVAMLSYCGDHF